ncbi:MAG: glutamate--tRNA ligase [Spirochaetes bacterium]|nr:glutamate--tRNA ligase [Spirochaetota bacterium]
MRLRFAPSPTGFLHIGNARTAILNHLIAKKHGATMVLRVEDTDMERSSRESEESILRDLKWLGIEWHEGPDVGGAFGPYRQSERFGIYREYSEKLLAEKKAYHCYCTQEELDAMRKASPESGSYEYSGRCRNLSDAEKRKFEAEGRRPTIRFRVPDGETVAFDDGIKGRVVFSSENIGGDFIIVRSDGVPVYNYIVIIDDTLMNISHVIRGEDHLSNTPKQILIARALGLPVPEYAHLALVMGDDRKKLSKRHGITSVDMYRREGYLPEALLNYLAMLGWAAEGGEEILPVDQMVAQIEIGKLAKSAAVFDFQKLRWMNGNYIRSCSLGDITELLVPYIKEAGFDTSGVDRAWFESVVALMRGYCEVLGDIGGLIGMIMADVNEPDEESDALLRQEHALQIIREAHRLLGSEITAENFASELISKIKQGTGQKGKNLFHPVRALLTGRLKGPELDQALPLIGFERCRKRVEYAYGKYCN